MVPLRSALPCNKQKRNKKVAVQFCAAAFLANRRFKMASALLWPSSAESLFIFRVWSNRVCAAMKAPVGLLSGRAVCVSRWRGFAPTSSAGRDKRIFTGGVVTMNGSYSAAFCESAALWSACSPSPSRLTPCHLSQRERPWQRDEVCVDCQGLPLWGSWRTYVSLRGRAR